MTADNFTVSIASRFPQQNREGFGMVNTLMEMRDANVDAIVGDLVHRGLLDGVFR
jgi:hypothetical protein